MSDLVERLRNLQDHYAISGRLGAENIRVFGDAADMIEHKDAEITQLKSDLAHIRSVCDFAKQDAEIAKLRTALKQISDDAENQNIGHRDFRINARHHADDALRNEQ